MVSQLHERNGVLPDPAGDGPRGPAPHAPLEGKTTTSCPTQERRGCTGLSPPLLSLHPWAFGWPVWEGSLAGRQEVGLMSKEGRKDREAVCPPPTIPPETQLSSTRRQCCVPCGCRTDEGLGRVLERRWEPGDPG